MGRFIYLYYYFYSNRLFSWSNNARGLDVGAIEFVHKYLVEQRNKGRAVLLVSFELDEIMSLSDEICVIFEGQITGHVKGNESYQRT